MDQKVKQRLEKEDLFTYSYQVTTQSANENTIRSYLIAAMLELGDMISQLEKKIQSLSEKPTETKLDLQKLSEEISEKLVLPPVPQIIGTKDDLDILFSKPKVLKWKQQGSKTLEDLKMLKIFDKIRTPSILNGEEFEFTEIEETLKDEKIPRYDFKQIYQYGTFDKFQKHRFRRLELAVPATKGTTEFLMISFDKVKDAIADGYKYMHIGAVQVAFKLLARSNLGCSVMSVLRDNRMEIC